MNDLTITSLSEANILNDSVFSRRLQVEQQIEYYQAALEGNPNEINPDLLRSLKNQLREYQAEYVHILALTKKMHDIIDYWTKTH